MRPHIFKYIEQEIYAFNETQKRFNDLTEEIIHYTPPYQEIRNLEPSDRTGKTATELATNIQLKRMEQIIYAIQISLIEMLPEVRDVLEDKYWKRPKVSWEIIAEEHYVSRKTLYRWRKSFIEDVARRLGER